MANTVKHLYIGIFICLICLIVYHELITDYKIKIFRLNSILADQKKSIKKVKGIIKEEVEKKSKKYKENLKEFKNFVSNLKSTRKEISFSISKKIDEIALSLNLLYNTIAFSHYQIDDLFREFVFSTSFKFNPDKFNNIYEFIEKVLKSYYCIVIHSLSIDFKTNVCSIKGAVLYTVKGEQ